MGNSVGFHGKLTGLSQKIVRKKALERVGVLHSIRPTTILKVLAAAADVFNISALVLF
jgi:hypothetical protein